MSRSFAESEVDMKHTATLVFAAAITLVPATACRAEESHAAEPFVPEIGEVMTFQQIRHAKLWFAGRARNWELAGFEVAELKEGFEAVARYYPTLNDVPLAQMIDTIRSTNFGALDRAIAARDPARFAAAFDGLTQACNACHRASAHAFIVIRRPSAPLFSNQSFYPQK